MFYYNVLLRSLKLKGYSKVKIETGKLQKLSFPTAHANILKERF